MKTYAFGFLLFMSLLCGCTRTAIPLDGGQIALTATAIMMEEVESVPLPSSGEQAVVWIPEEETLKVHNPAGIAGDLVDELPYNQGGIYLTGERTRLGSSEWAEIAVMGEVLGWVNAWNLTEKIVSEAYCADPQIAARIVQFIEATASQDGASLSSIVNPFRGLVLRHDWWNPDVIITPEEAETLFEDYHEIDWGMIRGGEFEILGSFQEVLYPPLNDVLQSGVAPQCNDLPSGTTSIEAIWPSEFNSINYHAFHVPAPAEGNPYDWQTWVAGFEYIGGIPYLTVLVQYRGDI